MISIKRFLDQLRDEPAPGAEHDLVEAFVQVTGLFLDGMGTHQVRGRESDLDILRRALSSSAVQLRKSQSPLSLLAISSDAMEALGTYCQQTNEYLRQEKEQLHSMVAMLTDTIADISGQTDASMSRLQAIEKDLEAASGLNDMRAARTKLEGCLLGLREAAAHQRSCTNVTVQRMRDQVEQARKPAPGPKPAAANHPGVDLMAEPVDDLEEAVPSSYVAVFKLRRAEHIASRFGDTVKQQMLNTIGTHLKTVLGPSDRLLRWKGTSFIMFISSTEPIGQIKAKLYEAVAAIGKQYFELGRKSALLAVGVDWILFPQSLHSSLEAVFTEVDAFIENARPETAPPVTSQQ